MCNKIIGQLTAFCNNFLFFSPPKIINLIIIIYAFLRIFGNIRFFADIWRKSLDFAIRLIFQKTSVFHKISFSLCRRLSSFTFVALPLVWWSSPAKRLFLGKILFFLPARGCPLTGTAGGVFLPRSHSLVVLARFPAMGRSIHTSPGCAFWLRVGFSPYSCESPPSPARGLLVWHPDCTFLSGALPVRAGRFPLSRPIYLLRMSLCRPSPFSCRARFSLGLPISPSGAVFCLRSSGF